MTGKPRFEDVDIQGIGNLTAFADLSVHDLRSSLPSLQYALYVATEKAPDGWPAEAMRDEVGKRTSDGQQMRITTWYVNRAGAKWERFYGSGVPAYVEKYDRLLAFIYERIPLKEGTAYIPRVSLLTMPDGRISKASARWCTVVLKARESNWR